MKRIRLIPSVLVLVFLFLGIYMVAFRSVGNTGKIGYMDLPKVFEKFEMKKAMEAKLNGEKAMKNRVLDSLKLVLGNMPTTTTPEQQELAYKRNELIQTAESFQREHQTSIEAYDKQILVRLNQYVRDYADANGYDFIFGAEGSGVIMAANEDLDLSEEIIAFVNSKYSGE